MKTFGDYLKELLIIIAFGMALAWLVSCSNRKQYIINMIHRCNDSIGMNKVRMAVLKFPIDSMQAEFEREFPPERYLPGQEKQKEAYAAREHAAYIKLQRDIEQYNLKAMSRRLMLEYENAKYQELIDSLKIELYK